MLKFCNGSPLHSVTEATPRRAGGNCANDLAADHLEHLHDVCLVWPPPVFSILYLGEKLKWNYAAGFGCIALAVFFVFHKW